MGYEIAKIDARPLRDLVKLHNLSIADISKRTGLSLSALHTWHREGKMPAYMGPVCIGLLAEIQGKAPNTGTPSSDTLIVKLPANRSERDKAIKMLELMGAKFKPIDEL